VYVKSLTLRGFKSFASATSLRFERGITCVVGPNGSGKSNIVDAFAWVMGEQGAKSLRGGKMDDVVFAGTASRPPLGRAEVTLTIDNTDGALPIDYTEVTISRLLFRSGQSEYAINGNQCRLLDVTELLSDSGLGREMHVIVGQGQLDEVLHAGPEARRALIEEAAGVLKHRRRKEKALRKLEAMQVNLTRLVDLTGELRRRLGPLGRQAAIARRAATIQADLRDAKLRLLADDFAGAAAALERGEADEAAALARRALLENLLAQARRQESALDADEQLHAPRLEAALNTWFELSSSAERLRGVANLARERHSLLTADQAPARPGRDPGELDAEAASLREQEAVLGEALEAARAALGKATEGRTGAEADLAAAERLLADQVRAAAARADQLARLRGQVGAARSRVTASEEEAARLADAIEQARSRARFAQREHQEAQEMAVGGTDDRAGLAAAHEEAATALAGSSARVAECRAADRLASAERAALVARRQALEEGLRAVQDGTAASAALLADPEWAGHVLGGVAALLTVAEGAQEAITAALGGAADAVAVAGLDAAVAILHGLKGADAGTAGLVIAGAGANPGGRAGESSPGRGAAGDLPPGVVPAVDLVKAPAELTAALAGLLSGVVVADDLAAARDVVRARPELRVVTRDGDLLGAHWALGGSAKPPSMLAMRAAAEEAAAALAAAERAAREAAATLASALADEERHREATGRALAGMRAADKAAAESSGRLGRLAGAARAAQEEAARLEAAVASVTEQRERDATALSGLVAKLEEAEAGEDGASETGAAGQEPGAPEAPDRDGLAAQASAAREAETDARLEVRTAEERLRAIAGRADALAAAAVRERRAAEAAVARRRLRVQQAEVAGAVAIGADAALARIAESLAAAQADREAAEQASKGRAEALKEVRSRVRAIATDLDRVVDTAHGAEVSRAEQRMRVEQMVARAAEEFGVDTETLLAEYGPDVPVPVFEEAEPATPRRRRPGPAVQASTAQASTAQASTAQASTAQASAAQAGPAQGALAPGGLAQSGAGQTGPGQNGSGQDGSERDGSGQDGPEQDSSEQDGAGHDGSGQAGAGPRAARAAQRAPLQGEMAGGEPFAGGNGISRNGASGNGVSKNGADAAVTGADERHQAEPGVVRIPAARSAPGTVAGTAQDAAEEGATADSPAQDAQAVGTADRPAQPIRTIPYIRAEQEKRAATAQRQLDQLGKVNPLALEEYAALEERHQFLANQLEDLKKTRRDLLTVVKEVDDRVQQVFTSAFADTAAEFEQIFSRLFPGGEGRLVLTEPDDMLATGIDVEARPPGKKVKRLSLLSGGERSLTAIAFLLAIFKARPSPFYVLDEVEAALDDTNLQRLLGIFEELRGISQLIIVTHQKRTMEVADALYGTTMQGDGVSAVVSQRLRERERA
jgi:chromosome segregation protein